MCSSDLYAADENQHGRRAWRQIGAVRTVKGECRGSGVYIVADGDGEVRLNPSQQGPSRFRGVRPIE